MASSETIIVSRPNGNGSNGLSPGITLAFHTLHTANQITLATRNQLLPNASVIQSASRCGPVRLASARAFSE